MNQKQKKAAVVPGTTRTVTLSGVTANVFGAKKSANPVLDRVSSGSPTEENRTVSHVGVGVVATQTDAAEEGAVPPPVDGCSALPTTIIRNTSVHPPHRPPSALLPRPLSIRLTHPSILFQRPCRLRWEEEEDLEENAPVSKPTSVPK